MASIFDNYERQFGKLSAEITQMMAELLREYSDGNKKTISARISQTFEESNEILEQMELELDEMPSEARPKYSNRVQCFKKELENLRKEYKSPKYSIKQETRLRLDSDEIVHFDNRVDVDMRTQLLDNTSRLERSSNRLNDGVASALQSEEIGAGILADLSQQRETLQNSRERLRRANEDLSRSGRILSEMTKKQNRLVLVLVIFLLVMAFLAVIYTLLHKNSSSSDAANMLPNVQPTSTPSKNAIASL
ncbi:Vesicle transport through interaction with t-SNAREs 1A [Cichlidogyrus casuarinus]|uniref:Vesicle transport through interaction with t-SNAREs 1A n=1 Tax=Cichlidogyrus casuarinus TaxID=1844966 RepID=A0ABD2QNH3_9PLAT